MIKVIKKKNAMMLMLSLRKIYTSVPVAILTDPHRLGGWLFSNVMFSMFGSGSVRPRQVFRILLAAARFEPNFENITRME